MKAVSESRLEGFEKRYSVRLPSLFREYLRRFGGDTTVPGPEFTMIWDLDRIGPEPEVLAREFPGAAWMKRRGEPDLFYFADHSIWVHAFSIRLGENPSASCPVFTDLLDTPVEVAPSFEEFLRLVLDEPIQLITLPMVEEWRNVHEVGERSADQPPIGPGLGLHRSKASN